MGSLNPINRALLLGAIAFGFATRAGADAVLTPTAVTQGFTLTTFIDGFPSNGGGVGRSPPRTTLTAASS